MTKLVYYEMHEAMDDAIKREMRIKEWKRAWKVRLIVGFNPEWLDLYDAQCGSSLMALPTRQECAELMIVVGPGLGRDDD